VQRAYRISSVLAVLAGILVIAMMSCSNDAAENACSEPGGSEKCTCADNRQSVRTCNAYGLWGACYCYRPGCGNGSLDDDEECDDGNTNDGDGCSAMCVTEQGPGGGQGGFGGNGPTTTTSTSNAGGGGAGGAPGGMGGTGGILIGGGGIGGA
jgi:cysteine-rich repeat protein